jgi:hypothetical protein
MKKQIIRISILQSTKICAVLYALFGCLYTLISIPMFVFGNSTLKIMALFYFFGPIWMGLIGSVFFIIAAAIYNWLASYFGGFEFEVRDVL